MWRKWWAPNNASKQQIGFNSAFKGLNVPYICHYFLYFIILNNLYCIILLYFIILNNLYCIILLYFIILNNLYCIILLYLLY